MSQTMNFALTSKNVLSAEEQELYELSTLAGVVLDPSVFKILLGLLKMNVTPSALVVMLGLMCGTQPKKQLPDTDQLSTNRSRGDAIPDPRVPGVRPGSRGRTDLGKQNIRRQ